MYIDIHCHLLPGVDDGVKDWEESLACLEQARREKVSRILVTPHIFPERYPNSPGALRAAFGAWCERASALGFDLSLGSEVFFGPRLAEDHAAGRFLTLAGGPYLLVELPLLTCPPGVPQAFYELQLLGVLPVLAHPERYAYVADNPRRLAELAGAQVPFQLTTHSVAGLFGKRIQATAFDLMERGWVHLLASDAHSPASRAPLFREAVRVVAHRYGKEAARRLTIDNPRRVLEGRPLLPVACERSRKRRRRP